MTERPVVFDELQVAAGLKWAKDKRTRRDNLYQALARAIGATVIACFVSWRTYRYLTPVLVIIIIILALVASRVAVWLAWKISGRLR
ncbi:hypothetical protein HJC99_03065 [Candidatus Saccharibacteria bacterium]|nr:hypothetical protein [Candidatus Saccharibacteria bacterium]